MSNIKQPFSLNGVKNSSYMAYLGKGWPDGSNIKQKQRGNRSKINLLIRLLNKSNDKCTYCKKELTLNTITIDHVFPRSKGGSNNEENLVAACSKCNSEKSNKLNWKKQYFPHEIEFYKNL